MEGTILIVRSMTEAMKGKRLLLSNGIKANVRRISNTGKNGSCGYGLQVKDKIHEAEQILRLNNILEDDPWEWFALIYLDNAATTYPKPISVLKNINNSIIKFGANPGRSGHKMSLATADELFKCREVTKKLFNASSEENILFTCNCTYALNTVIKGYLKPGDHVVVSNLEHNAVMRPLQKLKAKDIINFSIAKIYCEDNDKTIDSFRKSITDKTTLIICTHASNVWGIKTPIERLTFLAKEYEIPILVDAAQTAGVVPIDLQDTPIDFLCTAGHKGLYGPMGTGLLITKKGDLVDTLVEGGTGTDSLSFEQPSYMPDKFESGTPNTPGIIGLRSGIEFILRKGIKNISKHEFSLIQYAYDELSKIDKVKLYFNKPNDKYFVPLISFNIDDKNSEDVAAYLDQMGIATRAGLHCAPSAHKYKDTVKSGAVRVCPSIFNNFNHIDRLIYCIKRFVKTQL